MTGGAGLTGGADRGPSSLPPVTDLPPHPFSLCSLIAWENMLIRIYTDKTGRDAALAYTVMRCKIYLGQCPILKVHL